MKFHIEYLKLLIPNLTIGTLSDLGINYQIVADHLYLTQEEYSLIKLTTGIDLLQVDGDLYLNNKNITSLPDNLRITGSLDLRNSHIDLHSFPNNLYISRDLILIDASIILLANNLQVKGTIYSVKEI